MKNFIAVMAILLLLGCSQEQPQQTTVQTTPADIQAAPSSADHKNAEYLLVFFLDPNGGPCRMQGEILSRMASELDQKVLLRPVKTTVAEDRNLFYAYGIRGLPTILLADTSGKELKRLPPGVQTTEAIRGLLNQIPGN
ncbi:MAG: hypothetical protein IH612_06745 [Desulfofustis sp.]|nr:hypothetical protein [Desulfofustis sp.]